MWSNGVLTTRCSEESQSGSASVLRVKADLSNRKLKRVLSPRASGSADPQTQHSVCRMLHSSPISADLSRRDPRAVRPMKRFSVDPVWTSSLFSAGYGYTLYWPADTQTKNLSIQSLQKALATHLHLFILCVCACMRVFIHIGVCVTQIGRAHV